MTDQYHIADTSQILSPGIVLFKDIVEQNIRQTIEIAGDAKRLRPHCKTHKMVEVAAMVTNAGVTKQKCATFAEAEMLVEAGATDIFLHPPQKLQAIDGLLTNFHLPGSTLIMLVSALTGRELTLEAYRQAVAERYRFYSYGDCMLIL